MNRTLKAKKIRALQLLRLQLRRGCTLLELQTTSFVKKTLKSIQAEQIKLQDLDRIIERHIIQENNKHKEIQGRQVQRDNYTQNNNGTDYKDLKDISFECQILRELILMCLAEQLTVSFYEHQSSKNSMNSYEEMIRKRIKLQELFNNQTGNDIDMNDNKVNNQDEEPKFHVDKQKYHQKKCRQKVQIEVLKSLFRASTEILMAFDGTEREDDVNIGLLIEDKLNNAIKKEIQNLDVIKLKSVNPDQTNDESNNKRIQLQVSICQLLLSTACFVLFKRSDYLRIACDLAKQCTSGVVENDLKEECGICVYVMLKDSEMNQVKLRNILEFVQNNEILFVEADLQKISSKICKIQRRLLENQEKNGKQQQQQFLGNNIIQSIEDEAKRYLNQNASDNVLSELCMQSNTESFYERSRCLGVENIHNEEQTELSKLLEDNTKEQSGSHANYNEQGFEIVSLEDLDATQMRDQHYYNNQLSNHNKSSQINNNINFKNIPQNHPRYCSTNSTTTNQIQRLSHSNSIEHNGFMTTSSSRSILSVINNNQSSGNNSSRILLQRQASSQSTLPSSSLSNSNYSGSIGLLHHHNNNNGKQINKEKQQTFNKILVFEDFKLAEATGIQQQSSQHSRESQSQQSTPLEKPVIHQDQIKQMKNNQQQQSFNSHNNEQNQQSQQQYDSLISQVSQVLNDNKNNDTNIKYKINPTSMHTKAAQSQPCLVSSIKMVCKPRGIFKNISNIESLMQMNNINGDSQIKNQKLSEDQLVEQNVDNKGELNERANIQRQNVVTCTPRSTHSIKEKRKLMVLSGQTKENNNNFGCFSQHSSSYSSQSSLKGISLFGTPKLEQSVTTTNNNTLISGGQICQSNQTVWQEVMALKATEELEQKCLMLRKKQFSVKSLGGGNFNSVFKKDIMAQQNNTESKITIEKPKKDIIEKFMSQRSKICKEDQLRQRNNENEFNGFNGYNQFIRNSSNGIRQDNRQEQDISKKKLIVLQQVGQYSSNNNTAEKLDGKDVIQYQTNISHRNLHPQVRVGRIPLQEFSENTYQLARKNKLTSENSITNDEERISQENNLEYNSDRINQNDKDDDNSVIQSNTAIIINPILSSMRQISNPRKLSQFAMESQPTQNSQGSAPEEQITFQERQPFKRQSRNKSSLVEQMQEQLNIQDKELLKKTILHNIRSTYIHTNSQSTNSIPHSYMKGMSFPLIPEETEKSIQCFSTPKQQHNEEKKANNNNNNNPKSQLQMSQFQRASIRAKRESVDSNATGVLKNQEITNNYNKSNSKNQFLQESQKKNINNSNKAENTKTHPSPSNDTPRNVSAVGDMSNLAVGTTIVSWEGFSPDRGKSSNFKAGGGIAVTPVKHSQRKVGGQQENSNIQTPNREQQYQKGSCIRSNNRCQSPSIRKNNNNNNYSSQLRQSKDNQKGINSVNNNNMVIPEFVSSSVKNSGKLRRLKSFSDIRQFTLTTPNNTQQTPGQQQQQHQHQQTFKCSAARQLFSIKRQSSLRLSPSNHPVDIEQLITPFNVLDEEDFEEPIVASSNKCNNDLINSIEMLKKKVQVSQMALLGCMNPVKFTLKGRQPTSTTGEKRGAVAFLPQYPLDYGTCSVQLLTKHHILAITFNFTHKGTLKYNIHYDHLTLQQDSLSPLHANNQTAWPLVLEYLERDLLKKHGLEISTDPSILANAYQTSRELSIDDNHWMRFSRLQNNSNSKILPSADAQGVLGMQNVSQELYGLLSMKKHHLFLNQLEIPKTSKPARFLINQELTVKSTVRFVYRFKEGYIGVVLADMFFNEKKNLITVRGVVYKTNTRISEPIVGNSYVIGTFQEKEKIFQNTERRQCRIRRQYKLSVMDLAQKVLFPKSDRSIPFGFGSASACDLNSEWATRDGKDINDNELEVEEQVHHRTSFSHRNNMDQNINPLSQYNLLLDTKQQHEDAHPSSEKGLFDSNFEQTIQLLDQGTSFFDRIDHPLPNSPTHSPVIENFIGIDAFNFNPIIETNNNKLINLHKNRRSERRNGEINMSCLGEKVFRIEYYDNSRMLVRLKGIFQSQYDQQQNRFVQIVEYRLISCQNHLRLYNSTCKSFSLTQRQLFDFAFNYSPKNNKIIDKAYGNDGKICQGFINKDFRYSKQLKIVLLTMKSTLIHSAKDSYHYSHNMHTLTLQSLHQPSILRTLLLTNSPQLNRFAFHNQVMFLHRTKALGKITVSVNWFEFSHDIAMKISVQGLLSRSKMDSLVLTKSDIEQLLNHPITINLNGNAHVSSVFIIHLTKSLLDLGVYIYGDLLGRRLTFSGKSNKTIPHNLSHAYHKQSNSKKTILPGLLTHHEQPIKTLSHQVLQLQKGFCLVSLQYNIVLDVYIVNAYFPSSARKLSTVVTLEHLDEPSFVQGILKFIGDEKYNKSEHEGQMKDFNNDNPVISQVTQVQQTSHRPKESSQQFKAPSPSSPQPIRSSGIEWTMREVQRRVSAELRTVERYLRAINTPGIDSCSKNQSNHERQRISKIWKEEVMQGMVVVQQPTHTYLEVFNKISLPMHENLYSCIIAPKKQSTQTQGHYIEFFVQSQKNIPTENNFFDDFPYLSFATSDDLNIIIRCTGLLLSQNYPDTSQYTELDNMTSDDSPLLVQQKPNRNHQRIDISPQQNISSQKQQSFLIRSFNLRSLLNLQVAEGFFKHQGDYTHSRLFLSDLKSLCEFLMLKISSNDFPEICQDLQAISGTQMKTQRILEKQSFVKHREEQIRKLVFMLPDNQSQLKEEQDNQNMVMSESNYGCKMVLDNKFYPAREQQENENQTKNDINNDLVIKEDYSFTQIIQVKPYVVVATLTLAPIERQVRVILYLPSSGRSFSSYVYFDEIQEIIPFFEGKLQRICLKDICKIVLKSQQISMLEGLEQKLTFEKKYENEEL